MFNDLNVSIFNEEQLIISENRLNNHENGEETPEILFMTSYPPRECGIATYSKDLIHALNNKFNLSFNISVCAVESNTEKQRYPKEVKYFLNADQSYSYMALIRNINRNVNIKVVVIQHEFGFFDKNKDNFINFLNALTKPVVMVFHTVLPSPDESFKINVQIISSLSESIIVMTNSSENILKRDYCVPAEKISVIPHGTHLVPHTDKLTLKNKYQLPGKYILSTFGLLSSGKSIETTLEALPAIIKSNADVLFLIIGKTHPSIIKQEGEYYRNMLEVKVAELGLEEHVRFINCFVPLPDLLEYLQLTDIYLFTSKDPNQAVSGTFSYAASCGCPIISTPIPHAIEVLKNDSGIIFDFGNSQQLSEAVISLLNDERLRNNISLNPNSAMLGSLF